MSRRDDRRAAFGIDRFRPARPAPRGRSQEEHLGLWRAGRMLRSRGGVGLRLALLLTLFVVVTPAVVVVTHAAAEHPGTPVVITVVAVVASGLVGALLAGVSPSPNLGQVLTRGAVLFVVAFALRLLNPSLPDALAELGDGQLLVAPFGRTFVLLALAHAGGHDVAARVSKAVEGAATRHTERFDEETLLTLWLVATAVTVASLGLLGGPAGRLGALLGVVAVLGGAAVIAAARVAAPPPGGRRPAVVAISRRFRGVVVAGALAVVALVAVVLTPLLPPAVTEATPRLIAWITEGDFDGELPSWWFEPQDGEQVTEPGDAGGTLDDELPERRRVPDRVVALWPFMVGVGVVVLGLLLFLLRGRDWRETWRTLLRWLFASFRRDPGERYEEVEGLEPRARSRPRRSSLRDRFRPRDPRGAIVFDYLRAERALGRHDLGRDHWETPLEHAVRLGIDEEHRELAQLASDARYGRDDPDQAAAVRSRELSRRVVRVARSATSEREGTEEAST